MFDTSHIATCEYIDGDAFEALGVPGVSYVKTDQVKAALKSHAVKGVLLTHNSDLGIDAELASLAFERSPGISIWFGQNVLVRHPKLVSIPIGLERARWYPDLRKRDRLHSKAKHSLEMPTNLCLANFSVSTNKTERMLCLDKASAFATLRSVDTVCQSTYDRYLTEILSHKFVLCPNGNGVDTHRLWETLYLGRIPVVTRSPTTEAFASLPMVILDTWADLTRTGLEDYWRSFCDGLVNYSLDVLLMSHWRNRIVAAATLARSQQ